jgi:hypothetical protein
MPPLSVVEKLLGWSVVAPKAEHQVVVCLSEWPQTIFSGQMSFSLDAKTSRTVETIIHTATPAAMAGSKNE